MFRRERQVVSDLKHGDRRPGERLQGLCPAAGVAHNLFPTLPPAVSGLCDGRIYGQTHSSTVTAEVTGSVTRLFGRGVTTVVTSNRLKGATECH